MSLELELVLVVPTLGGKSFSHPKMPWHPSLIARCREDAGFPCPMIWRIFLSVEKHPARLIAHHSIGDDEESAVS